MGVAVNWRCPLAVPVMTKVRFYGTARGAARVPMGLGKRGPLPVPGLTPLLRRIVELMAAGCNNFEIAQRLGMQKRTVDWNVTRAKRRAGVGRPRRELIEYFRRNYQK